MSRAEVLEISRSGFGESQFSRTSLYCSRSNLVVKKLVTRQENRVERVDSYLLVKQKATNALVEVVRKALDSLLQQLHVGRSLLTLWSLLVVVVGKNNADWVLGWKWAKLLGLGHVLPIVDEKGLEVVGKVDSDFWSGAVLGLLSVLN